MAPTLETLSFKDGIPLRPLNLVARVGLVCNNITQWNLSSMDTTGTTSSVPTKEVSLFQSLFCTLLYATGTTGSVPVRGVSLFQGPK